MIVRRIFIASCAIALLIAGTGLARAAEIGTADEVFIVNHGNASNPDYVSIRVDYSVATSQITRVDRAYVRFDLSGMAVDPSKSATVNLFSPSGNTNFNADFYAVKSGVAGAVWDTSTINGANAPATDNSAIDTLPTDDAVLVHSRNFSATKSVSFDLPVLGDYLNSDSLTIIAIRDLTDTFSDGTNLKYFAALDSAGESRFSPPPSLVFSVPEPSTFALATLGLLGLGFVRRRKRK